MTGPGDDGFATTWAAGAIIALTAVFALLVAAGSAAVTRHRAESAADLAALAAATHAVSGADDPCGRARWVADRMRAELTACLLDGWEVSVAVAVRPGGPLIGFGQARAAARAGPVLDGSAVAEGR